MGSVFNLAVVFHLLMKWKKHLLVVAVASALVSSFIALWVLKPKYKSCTLIYPANIVPLSEESTTEQLLQVLESKDIRDSLMQQFDLMKHYRIDPRSEYPYTLLNEEFDENVSYSKTRYEAIEIEVFDIHPDTASLIANAMVDMLDRKLRAMHRQKYAEVLEITGRELMKKKAEMDSMEAALKFLRVNYGIINYNEQSKVITRERLRALAAGRTAGQIEEDLKSLKERGGEFISLNEHLWRARGAYNDIKAHYENVLRDYEKVLSFSHIITRAYPAERKAYPIRWIIVSGSVVISVFAAFMFLLIQHNFSGVYHRVRQQLNELEPGSKS